MKLLSCTNKPLSVRLCCTPVQCCRGLTSHLPSLFAATGVAQLILTPSVNGGMLNTREFGTTSVSYGWGNKVLLLLNAVGFFKRVILSINLYLIK